MGCHFLFQEMFLTQGSNPGTYQWQINDNPAAEIFGFCLKL